MTDAAQYQVHDLRVDVTTGADPHPLLDELRAAGPVQRVRMAELEAWLITGYDEALAALADRRLDLAPLPAAADPFESASLRAVGSSLFHPRRVQSVVPRIVRIADDLVDAIAPAGRAELVSELAEPLAFGAICEVLAVPATLRADFRRAAGMPGCCPVRDPHAPPGSSPGATSGSGFGSVTGGGALRELFGALLRDRGSRLGEEVAAALHPAPRPTDLHPAPRPAHAEVAAVLAALLTAGYSVTASLIGNALSQVLSHPTELAALCADPDLVPAAVEELLRFAGPMTVGIGRSALEDIEIDGVRIAAGELIVISIAAANRDPARFDRPELFEVSRRYNPHLGFGHGDHGCLGAPLARAVLALSVGTLVHRFPGVALAVPVGAIGGRGGPLRAPVALPVTFPH